MGVELPAWLAEAWQEWKRAGRSGWWLINWTRGEPSELEERAKRFPPKPLPGRATVPRCPGCGVPMTPRDAGAIFTCECGRKMTRAQAEGKSG